MSNHKFKPFFYTIIVLITSHYGYIHFLDTTVYQDVATQCNVTIKPTRYYTVPLVLDAILLIKDTSPQSYTQLCDYVKVIGTTDKCGSYATACAHSENQISILKDNYKIANGAHTKTEGLASILVHETCHFHFGHLYRDIPKEEQLSRVEEEAECDRIDEEFVNIAHNNITLTK